MTLVLYDRWVERAILTSLVGPLTPFGLPSLVRVVTGTPRLDGVGPGEKSAGNPFSLYLYKRDPVK